MMEGATFYLRFTETSLYSLSAITSNSHLTKIVKRIYVQECAKVILTVQMLLERSILTNIFTSNKHITKYEYESQNTHNYIKPTSFTICKKRH